MASQDIPIAEKLEKPLDDGGFDFLGKELDEDARIWNVYRDEVTADDKAHGFEGWLQTLDILLIFAGLFSAVVTAFLVESYKLLQKPAADDFMAAALYALVVATDNATLLRDLPKPRPLSSTPSFGERWTNALWFTSLIIALAVALLAILAKQWLQEFHRRLSDRPLHSGRLRSNDWTRKRWFYLRGITTTWPTDSFITYVLPLMLHIALFLFLIGLVIFLWMMDDKVAFLVLCLSALIFSFYVACTVLPLWFADAPTYTPLLSQTLVIVRHLRVAVLTSLISTCDFWDRLKRRMFGPCLPSHSLPWVRQQRGPERALSRLMKSRHPSVLQEEEEGDRAERIADMLRWLIVTCTSENAVMMGFQAVGSLDFNSPLIPQLREATVGMSALAHFGNNNTPSTLDAIRAIRSELVLGRGTWRSCRLVLNIPDTMLYALKILPNADATLFYAAVRDCLLDDIHDVISQLSSNSITTRSARLLLRCEGPMDARVLLCLLAVIDFGLLDDGDYHRIFELFGSWDAQCTCGTRSLLCLLPFMAEIREAGSGGWAVWFSSLPAFIASKILRYCARSGHNTPGVCHRHHRFRGDKSLLDFLHHPGWLHPMVWTNITTHHYFGEKNDFPTKLYMGTSDQRVNMAVEALIDMLSMFPTSNLTTRGGTAPLATLPQFNSHDFHYMLLRDFRWVGGGFRGLEVSKLILAKSLQFFLFIAAIEEGSPQPYNCTDALLGLAAGLSYLKRQRQGIDIADEISQLETLIQRCSWLTVDWSDPTVTHLAQHIHELQPNDPMDQTWARRLSRQAEECAPLRELIAHATPCTRSECDGMARADPALKDPSFLSSRLSAPRVEFRAVADAEACIALEEI